MSKHNKGTVLTGRDGDTGVDGAPLGRVEERADTVTGDAGETDALLRNDTAKKESEDPGKPGKIEEVPLHTPVPAQGASGRDNDNREARPITGPAGMPATLRDLPQAEIPTPEPQPAYNTANMYRFLMRDGDGAIIESGLYETIDLARQAARTQGAANILSIIRNGKTQFKVGEGM